MTQEAKVLVPRLRFSEFQDSSEWEPKKLGEIADFFKGKSLPKSMLSNDGTSKCIHYGELFTAYPEVIREINSRTNLNYNLFLSVEDDVLMPTSDVTPNGLAKSCCVKLRDVIIGGDVLVIRTDKQRVDGEFLARYIRRLERRVLQFVTGSTVYHLYATSLAKLGLCIPTKTEQQKIADCLGSLDDLIATEDRKLEALRQHKQGLMQQLFPQPGKIMPRLRFPEFSEARDWEQINLCDAFKNITNGQANAQDHQDDGTYPLFDRSEVAKRSSTYLFDSEAVILPGEGMRFQPRYFNGKFNLHQRAYALMEPTLNPCFGYYALDRFERVIYDSAVMSTVRSLRMPIIKKFAIPCPPSNKEQEKIADCLSSLDDLIAAEDRKLEALRQHKQGLMQQLFPSIDGQQATSNAT